jgi:ribonuclease III
MIDYSPLYKCLGYRFKNEDLLGLALTHSSKSKEANYERLEFLGDRILGFAVATLLYETFSEEPEGKLARRFMNLVRQETLADIARALGLSPFIQLSFGEEKSGGSDKDSVLADCVESLLAAVYLDGGIQPVEHIIKTHWQAFLNDSLSAEKDAKSQLQELVQGQGKPLPEYEIVEVSGSHHQPTYIMEVIVQGTPRVKGEGPSKRAAMQDAAEKLLMMLREEKI